MPTTAKQRSKAMVAAIIVLLEVSTNSTTPTVMFCIGAKPVFTVSRSFAVSSTIFCRGRIPDLASSTTPTRSPVTFPRGRTTWVMVSRVPTKEWVSLGTAFWSTTVRLPTPSINRDRLKPVTQSTITASLKSLCDRDEANSGILRNIPVL